MVGGIASVLEGDDLGWARSGGYAMDIRVALSVDVVHKIPISFIGSE